MPWTSCSHAASCVPPRCRDATRSATRSCAAPSTRRRARRGGSRAHARAAAALAERPERHRRTAHHIERSRRVGDEQAAALLEQAAREAAGRAPAVAARWLAAALRLSPDVPEQDGGRARACSSPLASALVAAGRLAEALVALQEALRSGPPPLAELRARLIAACAVLREPARAPRGRPRALRRALDALPDGCSAAAASLQVELAADALYDSDFAAMGRGPTAAAQTAQTLGELGLLTVADGLLCFAEYGGGPDGGRRRGPRRRAPRRSTRSPTISSRPGSTLPYYLGFAEYFCEHYDDAARHFRRGIEVSRGAGQGQFVVQMMVGLAHSLERLGALREASSTAESAVEAARLAGNRQADRLRAGRRGVDGCRAGRRRARARARPRRRSRCSAASTRACSRARRTRTSA